MPQPQVKEKKKSLVQILREHNPSFPRFQPDETKHIISDCISKYLDTEPVLFSYQLWDAGRNSGIKTRRGGLSGYFDTGNPWIKTATEYQRISFGDALEEAVKSKYPGYAGEVKFDKTNFPRNSHPAKYVVYFKDRQKMIHYMQERLHEEQGAEPSSIVMVFRKT